MLINLISENISIVALKAKAYATRQSYEPERFTEITAGASSTAQYNSISMRRFYITSLIMLCRILQKLEESRLNIPIDSANVLAANAEKSRKCLEHK